MRHKPNFCLALVLTFLLISQLWYEPIFASTHDKTSEISAPKVTTDGTSNVQAMSATLNGSVTDNGGESCDYRFGYMKKDDPSTIVYLPWTCCADSEESFSQTISGLSPGRTYEFWAEVKNSSGFASGNMSSFTTQVDLPKVKTNKATEVESTSANLEGEIVDDGGEWCDYRFVYMETNNPGSLIFTTWTCCTSSQDSFDEYIISLTPNTSYTYWAHAKNTMGITEGSPEKFTTPPALPTVITLAATNISSTTALLNGKIQDTGGKDCDYRFIYSPKGEPSNLVFTPWKSSTSTAGECSVIIEKLTPGQTYSFTFQAKNSAGASDSLLLEFTTLKLPRIINLKSQYTSAGRHCNFLEGVPHRETFTVTIDWQGHAPSHLEWIMPSQKLTQSLTENIISRSFSMEKSFNRGDTLKVVAVAKSGDRSAIKQANFDVIPKPRQIAKGLKLNSTTIGNRLTYTGLWQQGLIDVGLDSGEIPDYIPVFGGGPFEYDINAGLEVQVFGDGSAEIRIRTNAPVGDLTIDGLSVKPELYLRIVLVYESQEQHWKIHQGILGIEVDSYARIGDSFRIRIGPWKIWGKKIGPFNAVYLSWSGSLDLYALAELGIVDIGESSNALWMPKGKLALDVDASLSGKAYVWKLGGEGRLAGGSNMLINFNPDLAPGEPLWELGIDLAGRLRFKLWKWKLDWNMSYAWSHSSNDLKYFSALTAIPHVDAQSLSCFELIDRDYLEPDYALWLPSVSPPIKQNLRYQSFFADNMPPQTSQQEMMLQQNVFGWSQPSLIASESSLMLAWIHDDPNRSLLNGTKVQISHRDETGLWSRPQSIEEDGTADFGVQLGSLPQGDALCVWENVNQALDDEASSTDMAQAMEISAAYYHADSKTWSTQSLTNNLHLDHHPILRTADNGQAIVLWTHNEKDDLLGFDQTTTDEIHFSRWQDNQWYPSEFVASTGGPILQMTMAFNGQQAVTVYTMDIDWDWSTEADRELFAVLYDGVNWSDIMQLTVDTVHDAHPQLIYDQEVLKLFWIRDSNLVTCNDLNTNEIQNVIQAPKSPNSAFNLVQHPEGYLSMLWNASSEYGSDIYAMNFDPIYEQWGHPKTLTSDSQYERDVTAVYTDQKELVLAYNKVDIPDDPLSSDIEPTDLYVLAHPLETDLAILPGDISLDIADPNPGQTVMIQSIIRNLGDVTETHIPVAFYHGDPTVDGLQIGDTQILEQIVPAGDQVTFSIPWIIPARDQLDPIFVVIDPDWTLDEWNRSNNKLSWSYVRTDLEAIEIYTQTIDPNTHRIHATIRNSGQYPAYNLEAVLRLESRSGEELKRFTRDSLDPGTDWKLEYDWNIQDQKVDNNQVVVYCIVDQEELINELNEDNNMVFGAIDISN